MKKILLEILFALVVILSPVLMKAAVHIDVSFSMPPAIIFASPPELVVLPETYVYVVADIDDDIFFYNGWWWRPWEDHWYRSRTYNADWTLHNSVPSFYQEIPSGWRNDYKEHRWKGQQWDHQLIPYQQVQKNWQGWKKNKHWQKQKNWGVQDLQTRQARPQLKEDKLEKSGQTRKIDKARQPQQKEHPKKGNEGKKNK